MDPNNDLDAKSTPATPRLGGSDDESYSSGSGTEIPTLTIKIKPNVSRELNNVASFASLPEELKGTVLLAVTSELFEQSSATIIPELLAYQYAETEINTPAYQEIENYLSAYVANLPAIKAALITAWREQETTDASLGATPAPHPGGTAAGGSPITTSSLEQHVLTTPPPLVRRLSFAESAASAQTILSPQAPKAQRTRNRATTLPRTFNIDPVATALQALQAERDVLAHEKQRLQGQLGTAGNMVEVLHEQLHQRPPSPTHSQSNSEDMPTDLEALTNELRAATNDPAARENVEGLLAVLEKYRKQATTKGKETKRLELALQQATEELRLLEKSNAQATEKFGQEQVIAEERLERLKEELFANRKQLEELTVELAATQQKLQGEAQLIQMNAGLLESSKQMSKDLTQLEDQKLASEATIRTLTDKITQAEAENLQKITAVKQELAQSTQALSALQEYALALEQELTEAKRLLDQKPEAEAVPQPLPSSPSIADELKEAAERTAAEQERARLQAELERLREELAALQNAPEPAAPGPTDSELEASIRALEAELQSRHTALEEATAASARMSARLRAQEDAFGLERATHASAARTQQSTITSLTQQLAALQSLQAPLQARIQALEAENLELNQLKQQLAALQQTIAEQQATIASLTAELQAERDKNKQQQEAYEAQLREQAETNEAAQDALRALIAEREAALAAAAQQLAAAHAANERLERANQSHTANIPGHLLTIARQVAEITALQTALEQEQAARAEAEARAKAAEDALAALRAVFADIKQRLQNSIDEASTLTEALHAQNADNGKLTTAQAALVAANTALTAQVQAAEQAALAAQQQLAALQATANEEPDLRGQLLELEAINQALMQEVVTLQSTLADLRQQHAKEIARLNQMHEEALAAARKALTEFENIASGQHTAFTDEIFRLQGLLNTRNENPQPLIALPEEHAAAIARMREEHAAAIAALNQKITAQAARIAELEATVTQNAARIQQLTAANAELQGTLDTQSQKNSAQADAMQALQATLKKTSDALNALPTAGEIEQLKRHLTEAQAEIARLREANGALGEAGRQKDEALAEQAKEIQQLLARIQEMERAHAAAIAQLTAEYGQQITALQAQAQALQDQLSQLSQLQTTSAEHTAAQAAALAELQARIAQLMAENAALQAQLSGKNRENEALLQQMTALQAEVAQLQATIEGLQQTRPRAATTGANESVYPDSILPGAFGTPQQPSRRRRTDSVASEQDDGTVSSPNTPPSPHGMGATRRRGSSMDPSNPSRKPPALPESPRRRLTNADPDDAPALQNPPVGTATATKPQGQGVRFSGTPLKFKPENWELIQRILQAHIANGTIDRTVKESSQVLRINDGLKTEIRDNSNKLLFSSTMQQQGDTLDFTVKNAGEMPEAQQWIAARQTAAEMLAAASLGARYIKLNEKSPIADKVFVLLEAMKAQDSTISIEITYSQESKARTAYSKRSETASEAHQLISEQLATQEQWKYEKRHGSATPLPQQNGASDDQNPSRQTTLRPGGRSDSNQD